MYFGVALLWNGKLGPQHFIMASQCRLLCCTLTLLILHFSTNVVFFHPHPCNDFFRCSISVYC